MRLSKFGLIGYPLGHSFSKSYYREKFERENIRQVEYDLFPLETIDDFPDLVAADPQLLGVNVTIPYKIAVMKYLDELSPEARAIGAVNCIRIERNAQGGTHLKGFNTDVFGFEHSLRPLLKEWHKQALVLGNGGAARAVCHALDRLGIGWKLVSRNPQKGDPRHLGYAQLDQEVLDQYLLIINTTPLGTFPKVNESPDIPYGFLGERHLLYDLIYNPAETTFMKWGKSRGAEVRNGYEMLVLQAERNWEIWMGDSPQTQAPAK